jgi:3'-phosphoadenosine 5'-phosphosulfate sulfotransferase (PAPS reductase)/FAD synthetase
VTENQLRAMYLQQRQSLPTTVKIEMTKRRIREWYEAHEGMVYVAYSRGKDSTVLAQIVKKMFPDVPRVFVNTGLEYPEINQFIDTFGPEVVLRPKMSFPEVLAKYGYPVVSKEVAMAISRYRNTKSEVQKELRLHGGVNPSSGKEQSVGVIPDKYHYLIDAPFKISETCCNVMKKQPFHAYERETGRVPLIATMASDSRTRLRDTAKNGCNVFRDKNPQSRPMAFWLESDVWACLRAGVPYCSIYDKGYDRTGCMFCMFGVHLEKRPNRFERMKETHPQIYKYCMDKLGLHDVLQFMSIPH